MRGGFCSRLPFHNVAHTETIPQRSSSGPAPEPAAEGFVPVYRAYFRDVCRWIAALCGPTADVEDLAQEVFIKIRRRLPKFDGQNLPGWLFVVTRSVVRDHKRLAWFRHLVLGLGGTHEHASSAEALPPATLERKEEQRRLYRLLDRMNRERREAFVLFEIGGYSGDEIASLQGIPVQTVWSRLHRARREFMELLAAD